MAHRNNSLARVLLISCVAVLTLPLTVHAQRHQPTRKTQRVTRKAAPKEPALDQQMLATQVMLDRAGYSPGEIDGVHGTSTDRAMQAYAKSGGSVDALPKDAVTSYPISEQDAAGPFTPSIPSDLVEQATLPTLGYMNLLEALGERFHASPTLLKRLNPGASFAAGETIQVPNVGGEAAAAPAGGGATAGVTVTVRKSSADLIVTDRGGKVLMYAPVTTGSEHDPLPIGEWKVTGVQRNPEFHYNPALFWDAQPAQSKATIHAGPNNPVGVVWIDISKPHYGLHGTPEPSKIGKTESHGCVRLTNWDALKLASLVQPGTRVVFSE
jgi:lipoprotein-anchoring transpeptidase ErfK/SrfK